MISLVVALVGVAGTLSATFVSQRAALKSKQLDSADRGRERAEERAEAERRLTLEEKRVVYVELNASAHQLWMVAHDCLVDRHRGLDVDVAELDSARTKFLELRARTQMILPNRALEVADEVYDGFGPAYRVAQRRWVELNENAEAFEKFHSWFDGPLREAVTLLQDVLRDDLGVVPYTGDVDNECQRLATERLAAYYQSGYVVVGAHPGDSSN
ncbi:hypothetical protein OHB12_23710 [Nocardia sp. NBC_01730]|uniref:hypothetical protein n=1 Tax=Nocardia sp. NBC_01730 TaxID=2975998 RepID=UPI002E140C9E|nr:hypothetical protein OHB12_23710 [Nocardia sp. NBC_01730]